ncbi:MAG TPA: ComF family protein, partial [Allocoleopsis sp.]
MKNWQIGVKNILNIFLKANCLLCDRPCENDEICKYCHQQLMGCKMKNPGGWWSEEKLFVWGKYTGILKRVIAVMKYENKPQLGEILGKNLGEAWIKYRLLQLKPIVVPIPMHPEKQKKRGYNQADLIAEGFCHYTGLKLEKQVLERILNTAPQYQQYSVQEREKN